MVAVAIFFAIPLCFFALFVYSAVKGGNQAKVERERFMAAFVDDQEYVLTPITTKDAPQKAVAKVVSRRAPGWHGKRTRYMTLWSIHVSDVRLGTRTTLRLSREGAFSALLGLTGVQQDIKLGDADFDARYHIQGGEPNIVRGALDADVKTVIDTMFNAREVYQCDLYSGTLNVVIKWRGDSYDPDCAREALALTRALAAIYDERHDVEPVREQVITGAIGADSGSPFAVR